MHHHFHHALSAIGYFERQPTLAVAVSGGADSMALLLLAHGWAKAHNGKLAALTVDHGLRKESKDEALQVKAWCAARGIEHHILNWNSNKPSPLVGEGWVGGDAAITYPRTTPHPNLPPQGGKGLQEAARDARYALLTGWCREHNVLHLMLGHHQGDQAETLLFRLARGSNLDGLAAMAMVSVKNNVRILRPLLAIPKAQLQDFLRTEKQPWLEDPSNNNRHYSRVEIRHHLQGNDTLIHKAEQLSSSFGYIRNLLDNQLVSYLTNGFFVYSGGYGIIKSEALSSMPKDLALRALSDFLQTLDGENYPARSEKIERLLEEMKAGEITRRSVSSLLLIHSPKLGGYLAVREPAAMEAPIMLEGAALWDKRFSVSANAPVTVKALGNALPENFTPNLPKPALAALPSFWHLEELIAVPHIGFVHQSHRNLKCSAHFTPAKSLAGAAFFAMNNVRANKGSDCA